MVGRLILHLISGILGLFLAIKIVPGALLLGSYQMLFLAGALLGLVNLLIKPILNALTLPIRIITLGLFSLVINMVLVWIIVDVLFWRSLELEGLVPLFWTTIIVWALNILLGVYRGRNKI